MIRIGILGDRVAGYVKHETLPAALYASAESVESLVVEWVGTRRLAADPNVVKAFDRIVVAPQRAEYCDDPMALLSALTTLIVGNTPTLAVCGGFQFFVTAAMMARDPRDVLALAPFAETDGPLAGCVAMARERSP